MVHQVKGVTAAELSRATWAFAFLLVTMLFFTWGFAYGLLDVLNKHFQEIFGISKLQSTLLQLAYFGSYFGWPPFAGMFMRRYGYKKGIHLGLTFYSLGAVFFWPCAVYSTYGGFVGCTFVIGCGLSTLEVAANSYITVLGSPKYAAARLNFSQGFQGIASFAGPMIASRWFFTGESANSLGTVQWVYLAVAAFGLVLNVLFFFCPLPEITEDALSEELKGAGISQDTKPFWQQWHCIFGWVAQTAYVGAQVGVASFVVNYLTDPLQGSNYDDSTASQLFSYCQITFTVGRFVSVLILQYIDPAIMLTIHGLACSLFCCLTAELRGKAGVVCLFLLFYFESLSYPVIFTLGTKNLGRWTKAGSSLIVMGVGGGAWYPPAQAALADRAGTPRSYLVPMSGYLAMFLYGVGVVIDQAHKYGFRIRSYDELEVMKLMVAAASAFPPGTIMYGEGEMNKGTDSPTEVEKKDIEYRESTRLA
ncbi:MFS general substrate transporter [Dacryopinax primogenitus]|uniref:MFS general substrate transporter n=1 Tax=Dacryopinax primogenitus (strain DJM 731) TaxID=1858805 RepID=M5GCR3_DACPD|nr:MFS general substrate transporter [Dacryopinax primogenitus]EJU06375.1 MFS general substrate transporter [Dacryopinax primogenitus]